MLEEREQFILDWRDGQRNVTALCGLYGISRKTGYKWLERYHAHGIEGLTDRSRAPHSQPQRTPDTIRKRVLESRRAHPTWGARKLRAWLERREPEVEWPAASTIGELLREAGLVQPRRRARRLPALTTARTEPEYPNHVWTVDYKGHFRLGAGEWCYPLTVVDSYSRYLVGCQAHRKPTFEGARDSLKRLFIDYGLPEVIRSDNGAPFASTALGRLSRLNVWWLRLGIRVEHIAPGRPQQNGRHERLHRTLQAETVEPPAGTRRGQQERFDRFLEQYNQDRPHAALQDQPPGVIYQRSGRDYPARIEPVEYPGHWQVRSVRSDGRIKFQGQVWFLSTALMGERVGLLEVAEDQWQIWFGQRQLAVLDAIEQKLQRPGGPG